VLFALVCVSQVGAKSSGDPLAEAKGKKATLLFFIATDCPISNFYAPEIQRICKQYGSKGIACYLVYPDPDITLTAAQKHAREYGYTCTVLLDPAHRLVQRAGATITPQAIALAPGGKVLYVDFGKRRYAATRHDLRQALDAIVQGKPVSHPFTPAIGCFIPTRSK
jgi:peroxiredoxin